MTEITVANQDWSIINAVKTALQGATVSGKAVWDRVSLVTERPRIEGEQKTQNNLAAVRYITTVEDTMPEGYRGGHVRMELILVAWKEETGLDEAARIQEGLRIKNLAMNAVEASPPSDAKAVGDGDNYHEKITWGEPAIDTGAPWVVVTLPLEIGYWLDSATAH